MIDSSFFIWAERARIDWATVVKEHSDEPVAIAAVTTAELLHGVHRADTEERRIRRNAFVQSIITSIPVFDYTATVARIHAEIWAELQGRGENVGPHDLMIAATALSVRFRVVTANERHFRQVPGLTVENWTI